jgi:phosphate transport system permease protein
VSQPLGFFIELLAGVPSVLFGLWGILTLGPWLATHIYPTIANNMPNVPVLDFFRGASGHGEGLLTTGFVLALMIVPIITATTRDLFSQVPALPKEGGEALGMTDWEVARRVTLPWVRSGIIGATVLGLGRGALQPVARQGGITSRLMLPLALSYDHRVIDGGAAVRFILDLVRGFENFDPKELEQAC